MSDDKDKEETVDEADLNRRKKAIAELIEKAKGEDRSYAEYSKASGVSTASFTRIKKGDYLPSPKTIKSLTSEAADPQGGVTYDEMMRVAGYVTEESVSPIELAALGEDEVANKRDLERGSIQLRRLYTYQKSLYEKDASSIIYTLLVEKGIMFRKKDDLEVNEFHGRTYRPNLEIEIMNQKIRDWWFVFMMFPTERPHPSTHLLFQAMGYALKMRFNADTKLTYVVNSKQTFQFFQRYDHGLAFKGELSIILYDIDKKEFIDELYLSNYYEEDRCRELYLIGKN